MGGKHAKRLKHCLDSLKKKVQQKTAGVQSYTPVYLREHLCKGIVFVCVWLDPLDWDPHAQAAATAAA